MKCIKCGIDFNPDEIIMILADDAEPICDLCANGRHSNGAAFYLKVSKKKRIITPCDKYHNKGRKS